jgi:hypothetical protein
MPSIMKTFSKNVNAGLCFDGSLGHCFGNARILTRHN